MTPTSAPPTESCRSTLASPTAAPIWKKTEAQVKSLNARIPPFNSQTAPPFTLQLLLSSAMSLRMMLAGNAGEFESGSFVWGYDLRLYVNCRLVTHLEKVSWDGWTAAPGAGQPDRQSPGACVISISGRTGWGARRSGARPEPESNWNRNRNRDWKRPASTTDVMDLVVRAK